MMWRSLARTFTAICVLGAVVAWAQPAATTSTAPATATRPAPQPLAVKYEKIFASFDAQDKTAFPAPGGTLFIGSSTFTRWKEIPELFKEFHAINRGFGGSVSPDMLAVMDRYVLPYKPAAIVFYCGGNDLGSSKPDRVLENVKKFCERLHKQLPETKFYFVSLKQTIKRLHQFEAVKETNNLVKEFIATDPKRLRYIDVDSALCDDKGQPKAEYLAGDMLHPNDKGYQIMAPIIKAALKADGFGGK